MDAYRANFPKNMVSNQIYIDEGTEFDPSDASSLSQLDAMGRSAMESRGDVSNNSVQLGDGLRGPLIAVR